MGTIDEPSVAVTSAVARALQVGDCDVTYVDGAPGAGTTAGAPVLLVHAGVFGAWFDPLAATAALHSRRVITMRRAGYTTHAPPQRSVSIADHAHHAAEVIRASGAARTHVVGHSSGSAIALQLAVDHPELVAGLVLSEPPLVDALVHPDDLETLHSTVGPTIGAAIAAAAVGDVRSAFETFMNAVCGPDHAGVLRSVLGADGLERARAEAGFFFTNELLAMARWHFDATLAATIDAPVLLVQGGASPPVVHRLVARLAELLPDADTATVPDDDQMLPLRSPDALAGLIAGFVDAHPRH